MKQNSFSRKRIIHICIITFILIMLIVVASTLMLRYNIEGEENLPFNLNEISVVSTAESNIKQGEENKWNADILQKNDIFFVIGKNDNYNKEVVIKKVRFENFQITKPNENMKINIYRPSTSVNAYNYVDEYKVENSLEYLGAQNTNTETLQINNQGGIIGFSIVSDNSWKYVFSKDEKLPSDGRLLAKAGVEEEDISFQISFDLIIETESEHKFKSNITLDLPTGNILEKGVGTFEDKQLQNVVFKRF